VTLYNTADGHQRFAIICCLCLHGTPFTTCSLAYKANVEKKKVFPSSSVHKNRDGGRAFTVAGTYLY